MVMLCLSWLLLAVHCDNPKALLCMCQGAIFRHHSTLASKSAILRWMATRVPHKMTFWKTNEVPIDKFSPLNAPRVHEFLLTIGLFLRNPHKIKFGDKKPFKGAESFNRRARKDPFAGVVPVAVLGSCFGNRRNIVGFCGIDTRCPATDFRIVGEDQTTSAATFVKAAKCSIDKGFLQAGDVLALDNAAEKQRVWQAVFGHTASFSCLCQHVHPNQTPLSSFGTLWCKD